MARVTDCMFEGSRIDVDAAIRARDQRSKRRAPVFQCVECGERVFAHRGGSDGRSHFEHRPANPRCSRSAGTR